MTQALSLVVVAQEFPYPPIHGGRADVWRRLQAFKALGARVALVCWYEAGKTDPSDAELQVVHAVVDELVLFPKHGGLVNAALRLGRMALGTPSHAAARVPPSALADSALARLKAFGPQAVLLDSPYGGVFARRVCRHAGVPLFYRSHNIEHLYFLGQARAAVGLRDKLAWHLACLHLHAFERGLQLQAKVCFDISADDLQFWERQGVQSGYWLPPLPAAALDDVSSEVENANEVRELAFLGNLHTPNNVQGLQWLVEQVMPLVWNERPQTVLTIAGSRPNDTVRQLAASHERVQLVENVADVPRFLSESRVLVNPVLSGSGVNVKTLDMLMTDRPIVCTPQGVAGLPVEVQSLCATARAAADFARLVVDNLERPGIELQQRQLQRGQFSTQAIARMLNKIRAEIGPQ